MATKPVTFLKIKAILFKEKELTKWEKNFTKNISNKKELSFKEKMCVDQIYSERIKGEFTGFNCDHLSYDDVHDFAR